MKPGVGGTARVLLLRLYPNTEPYELFWAPRMNLLGTTYALFLLVPVTLTNQTTTLIYTGGIGWHDTTLPLPLNFCVS